MIKFTTPVTSFASSSYMPAFSTLTSFKGNGPYTQKCTAWFNKHFDAAGTFFTPSCTAALEMALLILNVGPGDEVIVPSFTFSSTASAVALLGATPVFVDSDPYKFLIDPAAVSAAITPKTKGVIPVL